MSAKKLIVEVCFSQCHGSIVSQVRHEPFEKDGLVVIDQPKHFRGPGSVQTMISRAKGLAKLLGLEYHESLDHDPLHPAPECKHCGASVAS